MDAIADSLVAFAVTLRLDDLHSSRAIVAALYTFVRAGRGTTTDVDRPRGQPYPEAAERLKQVVDRAESVPVRAGALRCLFDLLDSSALLSYLRQVATSQNAVAEEAVVKLANETGAAGQAIARQLYRDRLVSEPRARNLLSHLASAHRW